MERNRSGVTSYEDFLYDLQYHDLLVDLKNVHPVDIQRSLKEKTNVQLPEALLKDLWMESLSWIEASSHTYPGKLFFGLPNKTSSFDNPKLQDALATVELSVPSLGKTSVNSCDLKTSGVTIDSEGRKRLVAVTYNLDPKKPREDNSWTVAEVNVGITNFEMKNVNFRHTSTDHQHVPTDPIYPYYTAGLITHNMVNCVSLDVEKEEAQSKVLRITRSDIRTILDRGWINQLHFLHEKPLKVLGRTIKDRPDRFRIGLYTRGGKPWEISVPANLD